MLARAGGAAIAVASDHTTDSNTGSHTADPVPTLFYAPEGGVPRAETPVHFGEQACREGNAPRRTSHEFLLGIVDYLEGGSASFSAM